MFFHLLAPLIIGRIPIAGFVARFRRYRFRHRHASPPQSDFPCIDPHTSEPQIIRFIMKGNGTYPPSSRGRIRLEQMENSSDEAIRKFDREPQEALCPLGIRYGHFAKTSFHNTPFTKPEVFYEVYGYAAQAAKFCFMICNRAVQVKDIFIRRNLHKGGDRRGGTFTCHFLVYIPVDRHVYFSYIPP